MMRIKLLIVCLFLMGQLARAQSYVTIPDPNFVSWLQSNYPSCMSGNQMDTTCTPITSVGTAFIVGLGIIDLTGIQYFDNLWGLQCGANPVTTLPPLPSSLREFACDGATLTSLPPLPPNLEVLSCGGTNLTALPPLPNTLVELACGNAPLASLPALPPSLRVLQCYDDSLTILPVLPPSLEELYCYGNKLTSLPALPSVMTRLFCHNNQLTALPALPPSLDVLECQFNQLTALPSLPSSLTDFSCGDNLLSGLPSLPASLAYLKCQNNQISCFPVFPLTLTDSSWYGFKISGNPFTCLPNYVSGMTAAVLAYPLCAGGDVIGNPYGCGEAMGIMGNTFKDLNANCILDPADQEFNNVHLKLCDSGGTLRAQTYSFGNGLYNFPDTLGTYTIVVDTVGLPFTAGCMPGVDTTVVLPVSSPLADSVNFEIGCKASFDIGVQSVYREGWAFPGETHLLTVVAGDLSTWFGLNCASGVSGTVVITVTGPVTLNAVSPAGLIPSISGNVFTYTIPDFGLVDPQNDFVLEFLTNTTAQSGDQICVNVTVTPLSGDNLPGNNMYDFCYVVVNSYDPNMKEVYPVDVLPGYQDWFNFTVHFQNLGTAPAMNIRLADTLDANLDLETFQVTNYSHYNTVLLAGNILAFSFPGIMLADSASDQEGSKGFVQYRIKPKPGMMDGSSIFNTAHIYFDYNPAVVTNTTENRFIQNLSVRELSENNISVYPNPVTDRFTVELPPGSGSVLVEVRNPLGALLQVIRSSGEYISMDLSGEADGIYFISISGTGGSVHRRVVKQ